MEIWKDIKNYKTHYKVSSYGRVKSLNRKVNTRRKGWSDLTLKARILKPSIERGYERVLLAKYGNNIHFSVHRLVAEAFIPNPKNKATINHINEIKADNRVENLEWSTYQENIDHSQSIPIILYLKGKFVGNYKSMSEAARQNNFSRSSIYKWLKKVHKSKDGYSVEIFKAIFKEMKWCEKI